MKKQILIAALLIVSGFSFGQNLIETNKLWTTVECIGYCWTWGHEFEGDTVINETTYKKLWQTTDSTFTNWNYATAMRETPDGKVYQWTEDGEKLLYDFGLEVNNQFNTEINGCPIYLEVESIDSVTLLNGEKRKKINFVWENESWIEGIGSSYGLLKVGWEQCAFDWHFELNCLTENNILKYDNPNFEGCYVITTGIEEKSSGSLQVTPNPFVNKISIESNRNLRMIDIFDLYGKSHFSETLLQGDKSETLDLRRLEKGIYILKIKIEAQELTKKIIKI